jgi:hypothetical protein
VQPWRTIPLDRHPLFSDEDVVASDAEYSVHPELGNGGASMEGDELGIDESVPRRLEGAL